MAANPSSGSGRHSNSSLMAQSLARTVALGEIPNLPGFRSNAPVTPLTKNRTKANARTLLSPIRPSTAPVTPSSISVWNKQLSSTAQYPNAQSYDDLEGRYSIRSQRQDRLCKAQHLPFKRVPNFLKYDRQVLSFSAYLTEQVHESAEDTSRVRHYKVYYYLEDDSVSVFEKNLENSGLAQGTLIRRHQVNKPDGTFITVSDLRVGSTVWMYGKELTIVDCDANTRNFFLEVLGDEMSASQPALPLPEDQYQATLRERMQRETGADTSISRNRRMHPMKEFMEASLGKSMRSTDLGAFLDNSRKVLRFEMIWDDTENLYGDLQQFKMHYFLEDDTVEVLQVHSKNNGRDPVPKLLNRTRLPKQKPVVSQADVGAPEEDFWLWQELHIGASVEIFCRTLLILNADGFTRRFYEEQGHPLGPPILLEPNKVPDVKRIIPPYIGFGSEEDTLQSVFSIRPTAPNRNTPKMKKFGTRSLTFSLEIVAKTRVDEGRVFTLNYFLGNDTVSIREPPVRNSGHMGGNFLYRSRIKDSTGAYYTPSSFAVGSQIEVLSQTFIVTAADENTLHYMEMNTAEFPESDIVRVVGELRPFREGISRLCCTKYDHNRGQITVEQLKDLLPMAGAILTDQQFITLRRRLDKRKRGFFLYSKLLKLLQLEDPDSIRSAGMVLKR